MSLHCLLVDDDVASGASTAEALTRRGHFVTRASTLSAGLASAVAFPPCAIVLDRMLPDGDSATDLHRWRAAGLDMPIILLTVRSALHERIEGLDAGADDYLTKPFDPDELEARIRALVRLRDREATKANAETLSFGTLELDYRKREVRRSGNLIALQPREFKLLELLMANGGEVVPRVQLLSDVWNLRFDPKTKLIETHISRLRDKINHGFSGDMIETIRGIGYKLCSDE